MALSAGDRLGRFEILGSLGAGGMGEVYRARDHQLARDVAIKVLPAAFTGDADRRRRFEQEARAAGALNHPNILAVYDIGVENGSSYIVTEILDGQTLQGRMDGQPLPARKAADYAHQIAAGLAAAHERGVVHRDIKPSNLFVTADGRIKILDFGLAKLLTPEASNTETVTVDGKSQTIMGTVNYMSPEQARGLRTDHRTDVFSFGVVLHEMLSGFPPFRRATSAQTLHAILYEEPPDLPRDGTGAAGLERIVRRCLEKRPEERFQNFRDLAFDLETPTFEPAGDRSTRRTRSRRLVRAAGAVALLAAAAALGALGGRSLFPAQERTEPHRVRLMTNFVGFEESPSISPDGKMVAFTATRGRRRQVFVRFINGGEPLPVTTDDADHQTPRWLPDGSALMYFSPASAGEVQGAIYRLPTLGGNAVQRVIASIGGGDVSRAGRLACFTLQDGRIHLVTAAADGSDVRRVATLETRHYRYPRWSPDGRWIAFQAGDGFRWNLYVAAAGGETKPAALTTESRFLEGLAWRPDSRSVVYASSRGSTIPYLAPLALWEVDLDGQTPPRQLTPSEVSYEQPDVHDSGVVSAARVQMRFDVWRFPFDPSSTAPAQSGTRVTSQTGQVLTPSAAPEGDQFAYLSDAGGHSNIWVMPPSGSPRQITFEDDPGVAIGVPIWSPDGRWIAFVSSKGHVGFAFGVWLVKPDGSEPHQLVDRGLGVAWSPDGQDVYFVENAQMPIKKISVNGGNPVVVRTGPVRNLIGVAGSTIYFVIERALTDGRPEYEIRAAPLGNGPDRLIKTIDASRVASWQVPFNPSLSPDAKWLAVPLTDGLTTNIWALSTDDGRWVQVSHLDGRATFVARRVSWSADGRSVLASVGDADADIVLLDGVVSAKRE